MPYNPNQTLDDMAEGVNEGVTELFAPNAVAAYRADRAINQADVGAPMRAQILRNREIQPGLMQRAQRGLAVNPYDTTIADQTRTAQLALMQQMEAARAGPSLAAMQGQGAVGQSTQQALAMGALGQGRGAMLGAGQTSSGIAGDVARARMIEDLKARAGIGSAVSQLRGQDISSATQQLRAGQQAQGLSDEMARFYASQGTTMDRATRDAMLEDFKFRRRVLEQERARAAQGQANTINTAGTLVAALFGA